MKRYLDQARLGDSSSTPRVTVLELLFDVVYVFAITRVAQRLTDDFTIERRMFLSELGQTVLLLLALWLLWTLNALMTSRFDPQRVDIQALVILTMFASLLMAVSLPQAFGDRGVIFACTYVAIQVGRPIYLGWALWGHRRWSSSVRIGCWNTASSVLWIAGALSGGAGRGLLWSLALVVEYTGFALGWPVPGMRRTPEDAWDVSSDHLAERYLQFLLIALAESTISVGIAVSSGGFQIERTVTFVTSFVATVLFWRIYFYHAGLILASALKRARSKLRLTQVSSISLLLMVAGIVATGVGSGLVIDKPEGDLDPTWTLAIFGGPALFLIGRAWFEYAVFGRLLPTLWGGLLCIVALAPITIFLPPFAGPMLATSVLAGIVIVDIIRRGRRAAEANPPL